MLDKITLFIETIGYMIILSIMVIYPIIILSVDNTTSMIITQIALGTLSVTVVTMATIKYVINDILKKI